MASITLCMIVRDEERMLEACLASTRAAVDDIVVIDTGSTDATRRIATEAGARVFDFAWCDDFAAARNEALRHARGDWVLVLDADERLAAGSAGRLRAAVKQAKFDCGMLRLHDATRVDAPFDQIVSGRERLGEIQLVPRLLRLTDGLAYVDAIHENVVPWLRRRGMRAAGVDVDVVHLGATEKVVREKAKIDRNVRLLRVRLEQEPGDLSASGYLAHELMRMGASNEALSLVERAWMHVPKGRTEVPAAIHRLATARAFLMIQQGRFADARDTVLVARALEGDGPDLAFLAARAFESEALVMSHAATRRDLLLAASEGYRRCIGFRGRVFAQSFVVGASSWYGATRLGTVDLMLERPTPALQAFDEALLGKPGAREAHLGRAEALISLGQASTALPELEAWLDDSSADSWALAAEAVGHLGLPDDARLFSQRAVDLAGKAFVAPHRRQRLRELMALLAVNELTVKETHAVSHV